MLIRVIAILSLLTVGFGCQGALETEDSQRSSQFEIVGGQTFDGLPAVGAIVRNGRHHCTGTLISPRRVLTAAHCVDGFNPQQMAFVIGPSLNQASAVIPAVSAVPHPNYNQFSLLNDIGYIDLASDAPVQPMDIIDSMDGSWVGRSLLFVGYGASNGFSQTGSGVKRAVSMDISQVGGSQFAYADANKNTCNGDSGGPAFFQDPATQRFLIAGVTSYGDQNCIQFGVDTRVDTFVDFFEVETIPVDPCGGETFEGRCDGNNVVWCENEEVSSISCGSRQCGFQASRGIFNCL